MSKQHHFIVYYDRATQKWDIEPDFNGGNAIYDTKKDEWIAIRGRDSVRDGEILNDLRNRLVEGK